MINRPKQGACELKTKRCRKWLSVISTYGVKMMTEKSSTFEHIREYLRLPLVKGQRCINRDVDIYLQARNVYFFVQKIGTQPTGEPKAAFFL